MLCGLCWKGLLSDRSKLHRSLPVTPKSCEDWHYEWNTSWRTGHLQLETKSTLEFTEWRKTTAINWSRPAVLDLLTGLAWCGCAQHTGTQLHTAMLAHSKGLDHRFNFWARRRTKVVCQACSAVHVIDSRRHLGTKTNVLHVTRKHDLGDARARAATPSSATPSSADKRPAKKSASKKAAVNRPLVGPAPDNGDRSTGDWYRFWTRQYPSHLYTFQSMRML